MRPIFKQIKKGAAILFLSVVALGLIHCAGEGVEEAGEWATLEMSDDWQSKWAFVGGEWQQDAEGVMAAPENRVDENLAFYTPEVYRDFEAEFEFRWDIVWTTAGFAFRAQDACHYYILDFPAVGQHYRAEHFWVTLSKVDERGWREGLHMEMMHGVSSMPTLWHKARILVEGDRIQVWVDGRPVASVQDSTYAEAGRIGLVTHSGLGESAKSSFRNLKVRGQGTPASAWDESIEPVSHSFVVDPEKGTGCSNIIRTEGGELLVMTSGKLLASGDNGKTWSLKKALPKDGRWGLLRTGPEGRIENYTLATPSPFKVQRSVSTDDGLTWGGFEYLGDLTLPSEIPLDNLSPVRSLELKDGTLLIFACATPNSEGPIIRGRRYLKPEGEDSLSRVTLAGMNLCLRSTDGGDTWTGPINIDGPPYDDRSWQIPRHASEISAAQTREGKVVALVRPYESPFMWETWSEDGGQSWTPLMRGPFPMYACNKSMLSTESGTLLIGGRFPGMAVQVSRDSGMTWKFHVVDNAIWANGAMFEVEPDLALFLYGGLNSPKQLRGQFLRVTSTGLEPVR